MQRTENGWKIEYVDYDPNIVIGDEPFSLKNEHGAWTPPSDQIGLLRAAFDMTLASMQRGDKLTISFVVEKKQEEDNSKWTG